MDPLLIEQIGIAAGMGLIGAVVFAAIGLVSGTDETTTLAPLTLLKHYLAEYPDPYLMTQNYFDPYPDDLALRLAVT